MVPRCHAGRATPGATAFRAWPPVSLRGLADSRPQPSRPCRFNPFGRCGQVQCGLGFLTFGGCHAQGVTTACPPSAAAARKNGGTEGRARHARAYMCWCARLGARVKDLRLECLRVYIFCRRPPRHHPRLPLERQEGPWRGWRAHEYLALALLQPIACPTSGVDELNFSTSSKLLSYPDARLRHLSAAGCASPRCRRAQRAERRIMHPIESSGIVFEAGSGPAQLKPRPLDAILKVHLLPFLPLLPLLPLLPSLSLPSLLPSLSLLSLLSLLPFPSSPPFPPRAGQLQAPAAEAAAGEPSAAKAQRRRGGPCGLWWCYARQSPFVSLPRWSGPPR
eukprot:1847237-Alexandrium_andersonii.AAC.2